MELPDDPLEYPGMIGDYKPDTRLMEAFRLIWRDVMNRESPSTLHHVYGWYEAFVLRYPGKLKQDKLILEAIGNRIDRMEERVIRDAQQQCPIAFVKPSFQQASLMNSWSPEYEPHLAPAGYMTCCDWSSVRSGKTFGAVFDGLLWMLPNDPDWPIFEPYIDHLGREVRVLPRPDWDTWYLQGKLDYDPKRPPKEDFDGWHGCHNENHWKDKMEPIWRKFMPDMWVARNGKDRMWNTTDRYFQTCWGGRLTAKLYKADMQDWGGKELFWILLDEGPPRDKFREVIFRTTLLRWAYTPREAANNSDAARLAKQVHDGDPEWQVPGPMKSLIFSMRDVPDYIMPRKKREKRIAMAEAMGEREKSTIEGGFWFSSPAVFSHFDRKRHVLPITNEQVIRAISGDSTSAEVEQFPWLDKLRDANIVRGFDEGMVHPTACAWYALLRTGEWVVFQEYAESDASITERVRAIVDLSLNRLERVERSAHTLAEHEAAILFARDLARDDDRERVTGVKIVRFREVFDGMAIRKTFADSKIFKRDPNHPADSWTENYARAGLRLERAANIGPAERCDYLNNMMLPDPSREHLNPLQLDADDDRGCLFYVTRNCDKLIERLTNYLWAQFQTGNRKGDFTGKPEDKDDDLLDAAGYPPLSKMRWIDPAVLAARRLGIPVPA